MSNKIFADKLKGFNYQEERFMDVEKVNFGFFKKKLTVLHKENFL